MTIVGLMDLVGFKSERIPNTRAGVVSLRDFSSEHLGSVGNGMKSSIR